VTICQFDVKILTLLSFWCHALLAFVLWQQWVCVA